MHHWRVVYIWKGEYVYKLFMEFIPPQLIDTRELMYYCSLWAWSIYPNVDPIRNTVNPTFVKEGKTVLRDSKMRAGIGTYEKWIPTHVTQVCWATEGNCQEHDSPGDCFNCREPILHWHECIRKRGSSHWISGETSEKGEAGTKMSIFCCGQLVMDWWSPSGKLHDFMSNAKAQYSCSFFFVLFFLTIRYVDWIIKKIILNMTKRVWKDRWMRDEWIFCHSLGMVIDGKVYISGKKKSSYSSVSLWLYVPKQDWK